MGIKMRGYSQESEDYRRIEKAIQFIESNFKSQPDLEQISESIHLSKYHFDRLFKRWVGISPIQFLQFITLGYTNKKLEESRSVLEASWDAGFSGPGRLHDLFVNFDAMTPGEFKTLGERLDISFGFCDSPFGACLLAVTKRGICHLGFVEGKNQSEALDQMYETWPGALFTERTEQIHPVVERIFSNGDPGDPRSFNLLIKGTNFQINVWKALLGIPEGCVVSYRDVASQLGNSKAYRAVANAVAMNPIALLIPCHRVISNSGEMHKYRWGSARKKALIGWEAARTA
jgi:AraC family transcriptional regulator of adaptative response/methylated-DNA-[protein]-cysteine methyltransferase